MVWVWCADLGPVAVIDRLFTGCTRCWHNGRMNDAVVAWIGSCLWLWAAVFCRVG